MKRLYTILTVSVVLLALFFSLVGCQKAKEPEIPIVTFTLSELELNLTVGDQHNLVIKIEPEKYGEERVEWSSSAPNVASVSSEGQVVALSAGEAIVTAKLRDKVSSAKVHVGRFVAVERVTFTASGYSLFVGDSFKAEVAIFPGDATLRNVEWSITDLSMATIDKSGVVKAIKSGSTEIVFKIQNKSFKAPLIVKERIKALNKDLRVMVGGKLSIEIDKNFADYGKEPINVVIADGAILLQTDLKSLLFTGIKPGKTKLKMSTTHAEGEVEIEVVYPQNLLLPNMEWGKQIDYIKVWEKEHGGKSDGELLYDDELWMHYQNFIVETNPMQPVSFRRYYFDEGSLSKSFVLYPYVLCFSDKGGGMGNFSPEFLELLKKEGYSEPQSTGNAFLCINKDKKLMLFIEGQKYNNELCFGLTFMENIF